MKIPLEKRLKKKLHVEVGYLQDEVIELLYSISEELIMHGDTAIWRCYKGNGFSEDLDLYGRLDVEQFTKKTEERGLKINKIKTTNNLIFAKLSNQNVEIRVEINKNAPKNKTIQPYQRMDGSFIDIYTLSPDALIMEKISAYQSRRFIRDLYDSYHLAKSYEIAPTTKIKLKEFLDNIKPPTDEKILKALIYSGIPPTFKSMVTYLRSIT